jgi:hypothetical protein
MLANVEHIFQNKKLAELIDASALILGSRDLRLAVGELMGP